MPSLAGVLGKDGNNLALRCEHLTAHRLGMNQKSGKGKPHVADGSNGPGGKPDVPRVVPLSGVPGPECGSKRERQGRWRKSQHHRSRYCCGTPEASVA